MPSTFPAATTTTPGFNSTVVPAITPSAEQTPGFIDRRAPRPASTNTGRERRQFANSYDDLTPDAAELAVAIDQYKSQHRRRFINFEEMLSIMKSLGYSK